jgi:hypothetical protein
VERPGDKRRPYIQLNDSGLRETDLVCFVGGCPNPLGPGSAVEMSRGGEGTPPTSI